MFGAFLLSADIKLCDIGPSTLFNNVAVATLLNNNTSTDVSNTLFIVKSEGELQLINEWLIHQKGD